MLLRFHRLAEDRVATAVLLFHSACGFFHVVEGLRLDWSRVSDDAADRGVDLQDRAAARAGYIKIVLAFRHTAIIPQSKFQRESRPSCDRASRSVGRNADRQDVELIQHLPA